MLEIRNDYIVSFIEVRPGLTGNKGTVSFRSIKDGKYMAVDNMRYKDLRLKNLEYDPDFAASSTFKVLSDKFFTVSKRLKQIIFSCGICVFLL